MSDEYPRESELRRIAKWDFKKDSIDDFLAFIERLWWMPEWGFKLNKKNHRDIFGRRAWGLELHTGGWSGNESIMEALEKNFVFWMMCWVQSRRGGHYIFEINRKLFNPRTEPKL